MDGNLDPGTAATRWCRDADGDGYRSADCPPGNACSGHGAYVLPSRAPLDCDDADAAVPATAPCP